MEFQGLVSAPIAKHPEDGSDFPKWVEPHRSHIEQKGDVIAVPGFEWHVDRDTKVVNVLVNDAEHEAKALAEKVIEATKTEDHSNDPNATAL